MDDRSVREGVARARGGCRARQQSLRAAISAGAAARPNGIGFLSAEIPLRTFTSRPTEINRSFNTNSTTLSPH